MSRSPAAVVRRALLLAAGAALLVPAACSSGGPAPSPSPDERVVVVTPSPLPSGIGLSFIQQRLDEGGRRAQIRVVNGTDRPIHVARIGLDWRGYPGPPQRQRYAVPPGQVVDLHYRLPRAACTEPATRDALRATVVTDAGRTISRRLQPDGVRFLTRIWRSECDARRLRRAVRLRWDVAGDAPTTESGDGLDARRRIHLVLERAGGDQPVRVAQVQGSVLFELHAGRPRLLGDGSERARVPIDVAPGRCDEHGRSQSTQTWGWRAWVSVGADEPRAVLVPPAPAQQQALLAYLDRACGEVTRH